MSSETNVLIVEDEPIIAEDIQDLLLAESFKVIGVAHTGLEALDMLSTRKPNFVLLDIHLAGSMTGLDVAEVIHLQYHIPYIFLSSYDDENTLLQAQQHSPYGYLVKPFQDRTLLTSIKMAIANYKTFSKHKSITKEDVEHIFKVAVTDHEYLIITNLIDGKSYKQISADNFISMNTVKYHVKNIYNKFDLKGRSELASKLK